METVSPHLLRIDLGYVNSFLWVGPGGPTLIDAGLPWSFGKLLQGLEAANVRPADLQRIIITHADLDHIGGLRQLAGLTSAPVFCHAAEAAYVRGKKPLPSRRSLPGWVAGAGVRALAAHYKPFAAGEMTLLLDKEKTPEGFTVVFLPGHSPGQIGLYHKQESVLILGDALMNRRGRLSLPSTIFTLDEQQARASLAVLRKLRFQQACFGHGPCIDSAADEKIIAFLDSLYE